MREPLYDVNADQFTRGAHEHKSLDDVAATVPDYLIFLLQKCNIDEASAEAIEDFIINHPEFFEGLID